MDERAFAAAVADKAVLSKQEATDLIRATLEELGNELSSGEVPELAVDLPEGMADHLPRHRHSARPVPLSDFLHGLSERTGLTPEETLRGVRVIFRQLNRDASRVHLQHALSQLPVEYRELAAARV